MRPSELDVYKRQVPVLVTKIVNPTFVQVNHLEQSDVVNVVPGVEIDGPGQPDYVLVNLSLIHI